MNFLHAPPGLCTHRSSDGNIFLKPQLKPVNSAFLPLFANKPLLEIVGIQSQGHTLSMGCPSSFAVFPDLQLEVATLYTFGLMTPSGQVLVCWMPSPGNR